MLLIYEKNWIQNSLFTFEVNITNLLVLKVKDYESSMLYLYESNTLSLSIIK